MHALRLLFVISILLFSANATAKEISPETTVRWIYSEEQSDEADAGISDGMLPMTARLGDLFAEEEANSSAENGGIGRLDFGWMVNGQDAKIEALVVESETVVPLSPNHEPRKIVTAKFDNFGRPTEIRYYWIKHPDRGWLLDDVIGSGRGEESWTLSLLLGFGR
jgi:hypothetical protein